MGADARGSIGPTQCDANGQVVEQIANQVGTFTGSKGVSVTPGIYLLELYGNANFF